MVYILSKNISQLGYFLPQDRNKVWLCITQHFFERKNTVFSVAQRSWEVDPPRWTTLKRCCCHPTILTSHWEESKDPCKQEIAKAMRIAGFGQENKHHTHHEKRRRTNFSTFPNSCLHCLNHQLSLSPLVPFKKNLGLCVTRADRRFYRPSYSSSKPLELLLCRSPWTSTPPRARHLPAPREDRWWFLQTWPKQGGKSHGPLPFFTI